MAKTLSKPIRMDKMGRFQSFLMTAIFGGTGMLILSLGYKSIKNIMQANVPDILKDSWVVGFICIAFGLICLLLSCVYLDVFVRDIPFAMRFYEENLKENQVSAYSGSRDTILAKVQSLPPLGFLDKEAAFVVDSGTLPLPESEISTDFVEKVEKSYLNYIMTSRIEEVYVLNMGEKEGECYFAAQRQGINEEVGFAFFWITSTPHLGSVSWACHSAFLKPYGWDDRRTAVSDRDPLRSFLLSQFNIALKELHDDAIKKVDDKMARGSLLIVAPRSQNEDE